RPAARRATSRPMRPRPTTPRVLPASWGPADLPRSHFPWGTLASAAGTVGAQALGRGVGRAEAATGVAPRGCMQRMRRGEGSGCGGDVDVVHADAGADDGPQLAGVFEQLGGDARAAADDDAVGGAEGLLQGGAGQAGPVINLDAGLAQEVEAGGFELVADQDA